MNTLYSGSMNDNLRSGAVLFIILFRLAGHVPGVQEKARNPSSRIVGNDAPPRQHMNNTYSVTCLVVKHIVYGLSRGVYK